MIQKDTKPTFKKIISRRGKPMLEIDYIKLKDNKIIEYNNIHNHPDNKIKIIHETPRKNLQKEN